MKAKSPVEKELAVAYAMLREALPLAKKALFTGGVELIDQEAFWNTFRELAEFVDPDEEDLDGPIGINSRISELEEDLDGVKHA